MSFAVAAAVVYSKASNLHVLAVFPLVSAALWGLREAVRPVPRLPGPLPGRDAALVLWPTALTLHVVSPASPCVCGVIFRLSGNFSFALCTECAETRRKSRFEPGLCSFFSRACRA